jgi:hypothetical protein
MNIREAFERLVSGEVESFNIVDESGFQIRVSDKCFAMDAHWVCPTVPAMEEVEVKRWIYITSDGVESAWSTLAFAEQRGGRVVKLTGHYTRPLPKKIKKRVELGKVIHGTITFTTNHTLPVDTKIFAEYEEDA